MTSFDINTLNEADRSLHSLTQLIALTGTNALPNQADDRQANLGWNPDRQWLEGLPFTGHGQALRLVIDLPAFSLQFVHADDDPVARFQLEQKTPTDALNWWQMQMTKWGFSTVKPTNYTLETPPVPLDDPYIRPAGLTDWANWRTQANQQLTRLNESSGLTSDVRIWPHHFDTGVYYSFPDESGNEQAAIWAGYAIADAVCPEPYFYISGYSRRQPIDFNTAPPLPAGEWIVRPDWQGACLPVSSVTQSEEITRFFQDSYRWLAERVR
ncbi:hypothetical protein [Spirosoma linguale]|uniref:Uncharacterized protein n=1 Tax=Spirosoma linguale (strain ATCC 33905 / DSM 74 / LMG 10896 / Claus 1) TaxID=504472 RepID=D2QGN8_SPILD|nr:hypothetical protein Slin_2528 [Spirosoma linguale DSM 74]